MISDVCKQDKCIPLLLLQVEHKPVEEELVVHQGVIRAELHDLVVCPGPGQEAEPGGRQLLQHPPENLKNKLKK